MTKEVLISISGMQVTDGEQDDVEMITTGDYYRKNGKHYILFEEIPEGDDGVISNTIKIGPDKLDVIKRGVNNAHLTFEKNKKSTTCYATPVGDLMIGISTKEVSVEETEELLKVAVNYSLDINYEHVSECGIVVAVRPKCSPDFHLLS